MYFKDRYSAANPHSDSDSELKVTSATTGLSHAITFAMALKNAGGHVPFTQFTLVMIGWKGGAAVALTKHALHSSTYSSLHVAPLTKL